MLKHLAEEERQDGCKRTYINLDDSALCVLARQDPALFMQRYHTPLFIDEIQRAPELLPYIKMAADASESPGVFWLTGSQPLHLMNEVSESLAGRAGIIELLGLSQSEITGTPSETFAPSAEYFTRRIETARPRDVTEVFEDIAAGSLPGIRTLPADMRPAAFESYIDTYIMRDIRDLAHVGDELKFRRFITACAALTARPVVYAELARAADIDEKTAKTWLSLLASTHLVKIVEPYSANIIKRLSKRPVMHFTDTGLAAHLAGWSDAKTLERGAYAGHIFESYAFGEIYRSYTNAGKRAQLRFFRTNDKHEIDLLLERDGVLYPIEVKKTALPSRKDAREFSALRPLECDESTAEATAQPCRPGVGTVICMSSDTYPLHENAWAFPVWAL